MQFALSSTPSRCYPAVCYVVCLVAVTLLVGCSGAGLKDEITPSTPSYALPPAQNGLLAELGRELQAAHGEDTSGFRILDDSRASLYWRLALIDSAVSSLDIQTYLWYPDVSGKLLLERAVLASQRGVKVRLIVDDLLLQGHDKLIANLEAQPNIEFRIFNPWSERSSLLARAGQMLAEMERLNTRMHDKLLIVDGRAVIIGGRNIGDHYFGLNEVYNFHDTDLFGLGHIAEQAGGMFDSFWNSEWVVSAQNLTTSPDPELARQQWQEVKDSTATAPQLAEFPRQPRDWTEEMREQAAQLSIGTSELIYDTTATDTIDQNVISSMFNFFSRAQRELLIMNAYIIPAPPSMQFMRDLKQRGVDIRILTNSLASHDVPAVNSHYEPWRDDIIHAGVKLYEFRADPAIKNELIDVPPVQSEFSGLHSKTAVVDRRYVFVGSMNLDPRSAKINTEMGAIVDSPALAEEMAAVIERDMSGDNAWHVTFDENDDLQWRNSEETRDSQPARDGLQRVMNTIMKLGPRDQY